MCEITEKIERTPVLVAELVDIQRTLGRILEELRAREATHVSTEQTDVRYA